MTVPATVDGLAVLTNESYETPSSLTYKIDFLNKRISGKVDHKEAVIQAIKKILMTDLCAYEIYDDNYGNELYTLLGKDEQYIRADIPRVISDALLADDRVISVTELSIKRVSSDALEVSFTVNTVFGNISSTLEV